MCDHDETELALLRESAKQSEMALSDIETAKRKGYLSKALQAAIAAMDYRRGIEARHPIRRETDAGCFVTDRGLDAIAAYERKNTVTITNA